LLCKAELASAMPKAGGDYFFIDRSMGAAFGTLGGFASWFSLSLKTAFALFGIGAFGMVLYPHFPLWAIRLIAVGCCLALTIVNLIGVRHAGRLQIVLVIFLLGGLIVYTLTGLDYMQPVHFENFMGCGWGNILTATGMVFVSFGGLTKVASMAEEVKNPGRTLPMGMFMAFGVVTFLYFFVVLVTVGLLGDRMQGDVNSLIHGARVCLGTGGVVLMSAAALLAYFSTGNAGIMSASRIPMAMARDQLLPESLARVHPRHRTPVNAIWVTSIFMMLAVLFLDFEMLVKIASTMKILLFLTVTLAVILMRESRIENYRPEFHAPFYPVLPILGIIAYIILVMKMGFVPLILTAVFFSGGLLWYGFYGRIRVNRESAIIRIAKRIVPSTFSTGGLENELREILQARDDIVEDRFDRMIRECPILDIEDQIPVEEFFRRAAEALAPRMQMNAVEIARLLQERETQTSTILKPGLAIPHIVVKGSDQFHILLARSRKGIQFGVDKGAPVHVAFVLAGSEDLRNYHLRVLMFIAHITQESDFEDRWMRAQGSDALKNLILLSKRTRLPEESA